MFSRMEHRTPGCPKSHSTNLNIVCDAVRPIGSSHLGHPSDPPTNTFSISPVTVWPPRSGAVSLKPPRDRRCSSLASPGHLGRIHPEVKQKSFFETWVLDLYTKQNMWVLRKKNMNLVPPPQQKQQWDFVTPLEKNNFLFKNFPPLQGFNAWKTTPFYVPLLLCWTFVLEQSKSNTQKDAIPELLIQN